MTRALSLGLYICAPLACALLVAGACATANESGKGAGHRAPPSEPWRAQRPPPGPTPAPKLPTFQVTAAKNGLQVIVVEDHQVPVVAIGFVARAGVAHEPEKDAGLAALAYDMLDEGAGQLGAVQLAEALQDVGASLEADAGRDSGLLSLEVTKPNLARAIELLALIVQKPTFAAADFARVQQRHVATLAAQQGDPRIVARDAFAAAAYGAQHPYGRPEDGTPASVERLTARQAKKLWTDRVGPKTAALVLVGDVTLEEAKALADQHFGRWRGSAKPPPPPKDTAPKGGLKVVLIDAPGAPQTLLRIGRPVAAAPDPKEAALLVFNEILGGAFSSRLNMKLREEKQWSYGAFSVVDLRRGKGPFLAGSAVVTPATAEAVAEVLAQFDALRAAPPTDAELALAKDGLAKSATGVFGSYAQQVAAAARLFALDLPPDHYQALFAAVPAVTAADVQQAAERVLVRDDLVVVLVGDQATIAGPVGALQLDAPPPTPNAPTPDAPTDAPATPASAP